MEKSRDSSGRSARSRFARKPEGRTVLTPRDERLLSDLYLHQAMSREQIQALYFGSLSRCNLRLRRLFDGGFVRRHFLPWAPYGSQAVYSIDRGAVELVAERTGQDPGDVRRHCRSRSPQFLRHTLQIVSFRMALEAVVAGCPGAELERWLPEILVRHEYEIRSPGSGRWRKEVFSPDAFFRLSLEDQRSFRNYFVEVDLGNTSSGQWRAKMAHYGRYLESGLFGERFVCRGFRALVITTSRARLDHLRALAPERLRELFWFSTFGEVSQSGPLAQIWMTGSGRVTGLLWDTNSSGIGG